LVPVVSEQLLCLDVDVLLSLVASVFASKGSGTSNVIHAKLAVFGLAQERITAMA
jgi:hypothetical protein